MIAADNFPKYFISYVVVYGGSLLGDKHVGGHAEIFVSIQENAQALPKLQARYDLVTSIRNQGKIISGLRTWDEMSLGSFEKSGTHRTYEINQTQCEQVKKHVKDKKVIDQGNEEKISAHFLYNCKDYALDLLFNGAGIQDSCSELRNPGISIPILSGPMEPFNIKNGVWANHPTITPPLTKQSIDELNETIKVMDEILKHAPDNMQKDKDFQAFKKAYQALKDIDPNKCIDLEETRRKLTAGVECVNAAMVHLKGAFSGEPMMAQLEDLWWRICNFIRPGGAEQLNFLRLKQHGQSILT
jgi:hypothetical protein